MRSKVSLVFISRSVYYIRGFLAILLGLSGTLIIVTSLPVHLNFLVFIGLDAFLTVLVFYVTRNWHKGNLTVTFDNRNIQVKCHLPLLNSSQDYFFEWDEMSRISFRDSQYYKLFLIRSAKKNLTFAMEYGDDVSQLQRSLTEKAIKLNKSGLTLEGSRSSEYRKKASVVVAVILGIMMILWPLITWLTGEEFKVGLALVFYSGAGLYIYMVYLYKQDKAS